jgi:hypothetical protein
MTRFLRALRSRTAAAATARATLPHRCFTVEFATS